MSALSVCLALVILGALTAIVAGRRGFDGPQWFVAGVVAGPVPLLVLWLLGRRS